MIEKKKAKQNLSAAKSPKMHDPIPTKLASVKYGYFKLECELWN